MYRKKLLDLGIPAHIKGFWYLNHALQYCAHLRTMDMYKQVAVESGTTPSRVERAMRHALNSLDEAPSVSVFLAKYGILWEETENGNHN